jgi:UDP-N-acetylmuramyl pentapeptide synthase
MRLTWEEIRKATGGSILLGEPDRMIEGYAQDSRLVQPGTCFSLLSGKTVTGMIFWKMSLQRVAVHF